RLVHSIEPEFSSDSVRLWGSEPLAVVPCLNQVEIHSLRDKKLVRTFRHRLEGFDLALQLVRNQAWVIATPACPAEALGVGGKRQGDVEAIPPPRSCLLAKYPVEDWIAGKCPLRKEDFVTLAGAMRVKSISPSGRYMVTDDWESLPNGRQIRDSGR